MKVLIVSHAYVERDNHQKLKILSGYKDLRLAVIYPKKWRTWHGENKDQRSKIKDQSLYQEIPLDTFFSGNAGKYFYHPIQLIISIINFRPDLIYFEEEPFSLAGFQVSVISLFLRVKSIFFTWENIDLKLGFIRNLTEKFVFFTAAAGIAGNQEALKRVKSRGFSKETSVIPQFGVDPIVFHPSRVLANPPAEDLIVGFVGRPTREKGLDLLFKSLKFLPTKFKLLVVTSSPKIPTEFIDLIKKLDLKERVNLKTQIPHEQLPEYFNQMDVFVLLSRTTATWKEQFGRTLIEAMACGVAVIGSSSGAIPEVIGDAGLIFKENDELDLSEKIKFVADNNVRRDLLVKGLERAIKIYSNDIISRNLYNFLVKFSPRQNK